MAVKTSRFDRNWLRDNPDYVDILKKCIKYEEEIDESDFEGNVALERFNEENETEHTCYWRNTEVGNPQRLYQLEIHGFLDRVRDPNSGTFYSLSSFRNELKQLVSEIDNQFNDGIRTVIHDFPSEEELEDRGIFDDVVGYEDIKFIMRRAMSSDDIVNIALFGPPGSAKTVFLMCINKLDDSVYISGKPTTGPGFMDKMFDETPRYMAIDELDQMDVGDQEILSEYTETGLLVETKGNNKQRQMRTNTKTFAAANNPSDILDNIENRFVDLHFEPYTYDEFVEVCEHILPRNEGKTVEESRQIAEAVWDFDGFGNVRKAIQAARLSDGDPEKVLGILENYSGGSLGTTWG